MEMKEFIENLVEQFDDAPDVEVKAKTKFRDLDGWSSIVALSVMAMIDEEYEVQIKADEMRNANTVQELFNVVNSYL